MAALKLISVEESYVPTSPEIVIVPTVPQHLREIKEVLRPEDEKEILAFGITPEKALWQSYKYSIMRKTAFVDGKLAAIWGVCGSLLGQIGRPWLMTSPEVKKISPLKFARIYKQNSHEMLELFPELCNIVHAEYAEAIRLLGISGFTVEVPEPLGLNGELYRVFWRKK